MFNKLSFRNVQRSAKDYLVYMLTMTAITAFMYAFSSLFFDKELSGSFEMAGIMQVMIGIATFFIVMIVAWLINYMVRFILEKRSTELGIYMLLGKNRKKIASLYIRENLLLGIIAYIPGIAAGMLLQQILMAILGHMIRTSYHFQINFNGYTLLVTSLCYMGCYLLAMHRCRRKFKKMSIQALMKAKRQNEEIKESHESIRKLLLPVSVLIIVAFGIFFPLLTDIGILLAFLLLLVVAIYLFYMGISAWIICYIRKKKDGIYKGQNLFLLRQFSSKVRTMQFTMGTLTALFTVAFMGCSMAMMFSDFQNKLLDSKWLFDVQIYNSDSAYDFAKEQEIITKKADEKVHYIYRIYTDEQQQANTWMYTHLNVFKSTVQGEDGSIDLKVVEQLLEEDTTYCKYDTYMGLSDYNYLRKMLGYKEIVLQENEYAIHIKSRLREEAAKMPDDLNILDADGENPLQCGGVYSEPFSQDGHNGGDYLLVVPDAVISTMQPYYSELVVELDGEAPKDLQLELENILNTDETEYMGGREAKLNRNSCGGSDMIVVYMASHIVRDNLIPEVKYLLSSLIVPGFYIGLVFLCVALTVLSVQQLSDSAKYKSRYDVLGKIGLERSQINKLVGKQLMGFYLCLAIFAMVISGNVILRFSKMFIETTGVPTSVGQYFVYQCFYSSESIWFTIWQPI